MSRAFDLAIALAKGIPEAVVLLDPSLKSLYYNSAYLRLAGQSKHALEKRMSSGESPLNIVGQQGNSDLTVVRSCIDERETITLAEVAIANLDGEAFTASISFVPIIDEDTGTLEGVLEIIRNYTAESVVQERFKKLLAAERERAQELERRVEERTRELEEALSHLSRLSRLDPLTGLLNRRAFAERSDQILKLAKRHDRSFALLICDLDKFKRINDRYGHQAGDALLVAVSESLLKSVRSADNVGRLGGEEFIILLAEPAPEAVLTIAERFAGAIRNLPLAEIIPGSNERQTISIGIAMFPLHGDSIDVLIRHADQALYHAKDLGRDCIVVFDNSLEKEPGECSQQLAPRVLIIDSDGKRLEAYNRALSPTHRVATSTSLSLATMLWHREAFDALIIDETIAHEMNGELKAMVGESPLTLRVVVSPEEKNPKNDGIHFTLSRREAATQLVNVLQSGFAWREADTRSFDKANWRVFAIKKLEKDHIDHLLAERNFLFVYQPIVRMGDEKRFGYEALVRAKHNVDGEYDPRGLIEAVLRTGNIWPFGRLVREMAPEPLSTLPKDTTLFINMHPEEMEDPSLMDPSMLPTLFARQIVFEISEGSAIADFPYLRKRMTQLRELGYRFAIDDLGSAYAGLKSVAMLEPEFIKFDMELIRGIELSCRKLSLVRKIIDFCNEEHITAIAEGVETKEEAEVLQGLGCPLFQGFFFGRPAALFDPKK